MNSAESNQKDRSTMIDDLYNEIMNLRVEVVNLKRQKSSIEDKEAATAVIKEKTELLNDLEKDFREMVKSQSIMNRYEKSIGKQLKGGAVIKTLPEAKSNIGEIVRNIPRANTQEQ